MRTTPFLTLVTLLGVSTMPAFADLTLSTGRPGNLLAYGADAVITAKGADAAVAWRVTDFEGNQAASGTCAPVNGSATITIPGLDRGYYEITCKAGESEAILAFGVVTDHSAQDPPDTRLNVDGATAWLEGAGRHDQLAKMLRIIGMGWVRERYSWGATEPEAGKVNYRPGGRDYDRVADVFTAEGVRVYQIFHDSPGWTRPDSGESRNPRDLRDVYRFAKRTAEHYKGAVAAWEVWNEPDIGFWPDLGDTFAGLQKAAYLGFKAGDPDLPVLLGSFCRGYSAFDENLFEAGIAGYFDIFNWHIYAPPDRYAPTLDGYLKMLERYQCADRPVWLTEAGIRLDANEPGGELNADSEARQARFIAPSFASSLAAGTDKHFFFVYPYYLENGVQFGALRKDLSPRPGFIAIAAAVDILGDARYLGRYDFGPDTHNVWGLGFDRGDGAVLVVWADKDTPVQVNTGMRSVTVADLLGRRRQAQTDGGTLSITAGQSPVYILGCGDEMLAGLRGVVRDPGNLPETSPDPLVVRGQALLESLDKGANAYMIAEPFTYQVELCNLSETDDVRGQARFELPEGWTADPAGGSAFELGPMARQVFTVKLIPGKPRREIQKLTVRAIVEGRNPAPSVSYFRFDATRIQPRDARRLELNDPSAWGKNISSNGTMEIKPAEGGGARFEAAFRQAGDRWCYPRVVFDQPRDFSDYDGIRLEYRTGGDENIGVRLQVMEPAGPSYLTGGPWPATDEWKTVVVSFADLVWGSFSQTDANGKLDTDAIHGLMVGLNTRKDDVWLEVRNLELVRLWD